MSYPFAATQEQMDALLGLAPKKTFPDLAAMAKNIPAVKKEDTVDNTLPVVPGVSIKTTQTPENFIATMAPPKPKETTESFKRDTRQQERTLSTPVLDQDYLIQLGVSQGKPVSEMQTDAYNIAKDWEKPILEKRGQRFKQMTVQDLPEYQALQSIASKEKEQLQALQKYNKPQMDLTGLMTAADVATGGQYGLRAGYKPPENAGLKLYADKLKELREAESAPIKYGQDILKQMTGKAGEGSKNIFVLGDSSKMQTGDQAEDDATKNFYRYVAPNVKKDIENISSKYRFTRKALEDSADKEMDQRKYVSLIRAMLNETEGKRISDADLKFAMRGSFKWADQFYSWLSKGEEGELDDIEYASLRSTVERAARHSMKQIQETIAGRARAHSKGPSGKMLASPEYIENYMYDAAGVPRDDVEAIRRTLGSETEVEAGMEVKAPSVKLMDALKGAKK